MVLATSFASAVAIPNDASLDSRQVTVKEKVVEPVSKRQVTVKEKVVESV